MAEKRKCEDNKEIVSKQLKQLEYDDIELDKTDLLEDLQCSLEYDSMLNMFVFAMEKRREEGNRYISVGEEEIKSMLTLLPALDKVSKRYATKRSPRLIDIPFETSTAEIGEIVTVMSLKENMYKRGNFDVYIRKCVKKEDGSYRYTADGVRFGNNMIPQFKDVLNQYRSLIDQALNKTEQVMMYEAAYAVIQEISQLTQCNGCKINHPSQKQHMCQGGCLDDENPTWDQTVHQYWQAVWCLVDGNDVLKLARKAVQGQEDLQKTFIPGLVPLEKVSEPEVKEAVLRKDELEKTSPLFKLFSSSENVTVIL